MLHPEFEFSLRRRTALQACYRHRPRQAEVPLDGLTKLLRRRQESLRLSLLPSSARSILHTFLVRRSAVVLLDVLPEVGTVEPVDRPSVLLNDPTKQRPILEVLEQTSQIDIAILYHFSLKYFFMCPFCNLLHDLRRRFLFPHRQLLD